MSTYAPVNQRLEIDPIVFQTDLEAFNELILRFQDMLFNQAYRMLGSEDDAADLVQDALLTAYRKRSMYRGGSVRAWLLRIVVNLCYDELRRRYRRPTLPLEPASGSDDMVEEEGPWLEDPALLPEQLVELRDLDTSIEQVLTRLSPDYRAAVLLVDVQGLDYAEAAEALSIPIGTLKSRLARARTQLREGLGQMVHGGCLPEKRPAPGARPVVTFDQVWAAC